MDREIISSSSILQIIKGESAIMLQIAHRLASIVILFDILMREVFLHSYISIRRDTASKRRSSSKS